MSRIQMQTVLVMLLGVCPVGILADEAPSKKPAEEIPENAKATTIWESKSTSSWATESALFLKLNPPTKSGEIKGARLANVTGRIHWLGHPDPLLTLHPEPTSWVIRFDGRPDGATTLVIELDGPPIVFDANSVVKASDDHVILLPAKFAQTHGTNLRYEPQPHKNTVGYWSQEKDTVSWKFQCKAQGVYEVDILQGCGKGHGGSEVEVRVADHALKFEVQETGHFQNFIWRTLGEVTLVESESASLQIIPVRKAGGAVMDVRAVRLVPKGHERSRQPELADPASLPRDQ